MSASYPRVDDRAPCRHGDPDRFFPTGPPPQELLDECTPCPFLEECSAYAIEHDVSGVWGGLGAGDRRRLRKERGITPRTAHVGRLIPPVYTPANPAQCGTRSGYSRHRKHGELPCQPCREAMSEYSRAYNLKKKGLA
jgi:hypothetical protein